ncbi:MAG: DMT family transporter [Xanthobacteraceae bacterium]|nr:DMT family transporter [Xanthobacteraceae bacterium]
MTPTCHPDGRVTGWVIPERPAEPAPLPLAKPTDNVPLGIIWMIGATVLLAVAAAVAKWQTEFYPVGEVMFIRSFAGLVVCAAIILPMSGFAVFATKRPGAHVARGVSQAISQTLTVVAVSLMPLAGAVAISFSAPLWAALLSILWLKERAGPVRWMVLLTGFSGVIIVTNPGADAFQIGALFALGNAIMYGSVTVAVRGMTATETPPTLLMWQMVTMTLCHSLLLLFGFRWPTAADAAMMAFGGIANAAAQYAWTKALLLAPTSAVSPFYYLMLVWAMVIGFVVWGDIPTTALIIGSAIVIASGLFLLWHEAKRAR